MNDLALDGHGFEKGDFTFGKGWVGVVRRRVWVECQSERGGWGVD
jgi:hypothetical protein